MPLSVPDQKELISCGFVHVTGLMLKEKDLPNMPVMAHPEEYGCWDRAPTDRPRFLLVTTEGEVWIMVGDLGDLTDGLLEKFCPNDRYPKATWPTFWALNSDDILLRLRRPYSGYTPCSPSEDELEKYCKRQLSIRE